MRPRTRVSILPVPVPIIVTIRTHAIRNWMAKRTEFLREGVRVLREALVHATGATRIRDFARAGTAAWDIGHGADADRANCLLTDRPPCHDPRVAPPAHRAQLQHLGSFTWSFTS